MFGLMKAGNKLTMFIIIAVIVIALIVTIYFIGRRSAKVKVEQVPLPTDQPGAIQLTNQEASKVRQIATALHDDMNGLSWGSHNIVPYNDLTMLSDTLFVAVYNDFNNLFASEGDGTLREWIAAEKALPGSSWINIAGNIIARMDKLGLR